ncbi:hypothetical protein JQ615_11965 [Bradyrhizobium jicamae]|uniref:Transcriptional regulator n=1 Tax=Bradyrhizobium jicamae TaxID=280332 RepID=A0ABS5FH49_9BRAD|nr:hypothetical protein [Bradyrhizobium jicamae]MBR0796105.1 hypothetical protein [Bradyrhizobium jicamae]
MTHTQTSEDSLIPTSDVRARYGGRSHMWIERRLKDDPTFPRPIYIARMRYWRLAELIAWERAKAAAERPAIVVPRQPAARRQPVAA